MYQNLKILRKSKGISAINMAKIIGVKTVSAYTKKENGAVKFTLQEAKIISDFFHLPIEQIFFRDKLS